MSSSYDEFSGSSVSGYSPENFYTHAGDYDHPKFLHDGHNKKYRVSNHLHRMVLKIVSELGDVYESQGDFIRDACHHRAVWLLDRNNFSQATANLIEHGIAVSEMQASVERNKHYEALYMLLKNEIRDSVSTQSRLELQLHAKDIALTVVDPHWAQLIRDLG